jgi:hypothetical protein
MSAMTYAALLLLLTAADPHLAPRAERTFVLSKLTPAEALRLDGKRARFRVALDSAEDPDWNGFVGYDCATPDDIARTVLLYRGQDLADEMTVEATLRVIRHAATVGELGTFFPTFTEYRLTR